MPAGTAVAPGRRPRRLAQLGVLPEDEIQRIELGVIHLYARAGTQVVYFLAREPAVLRELSHRVHDVAVDGHIGISLVDQGLRHGDDRSDVLGRPRLEVGRLKPESRAILVHGRCEAPRKIGPILAIGGGALDDLVVDVGDIAHIRDRVTQRSQVTLDQVEDRQHARVTDMDIVVVRHSAHIHADFAGAQRLEFLLLARK